MRQPRDLGLFGRAEPLGSVTTVAALQCLRFEPSNPAAHNIEAMACLGNYLLDGCAGLVQPYYLMLLSVTQPHHCQPTHSSNQPQRALGATMMPVVTVSITHATGKKASPA